MCPPSSFLSPLALRGSCTAILRGSDKTVPDRKVFDAHFHIGAYGTQSVYGRDIRPIARALDHRTGDDCAAYLVRNGVQGGVVVPTYLDEQEIAFSYNTLVLMQSSGMLPW